MQHDARSRFGFRLVTLARHWRRVIDRELARSGLTDASWAPLIHLDEGGDDISQSELAERVGLDGSSLVRLIDLLEQRGLVERRVDPADRRARRILLTGPGRAEIAALRERLLRIETAMLAPLDDTALDRLAADFDRVASGIRAVETAGRAGEGEARHVATPDADGEPGGTA